MHDCYVNMHPEDRPVNWGATALVTVILIYLVRKCRKNEIGQFACG